MSDICFVSVCCGPLDMKEYRKFVYPTVNRYCKKYNIDFHLYQETFDKKRPPQWTKIPAVKKHINDYDWVVWIDADIMIMNHTINIREYIDDQYKFIATKRPDFGLNSGLCFFKGKDKWIRKFLHFVYYDDNEFVKNPDKLYWEQSSMKEVLKKKNVEEKYVLLRDPVIHKFWPLELPKPEHLLLHPEDSVAGMWVKNFKNDVYFEFGDFSVHVLGRPYDERGKYFKFFYKEVTWS